MKNALIVFEGKEIRKLWHNNEWHYSIIDIVAILTESQNARRYWSDLKIKLKEEGVELYDFIVQLKLPTTDGKYYTTDCANNKSLFRIIQSIPSKKVEPFKMWFAQLGKERIEEIENPELAQDRVKDYYELKGYPKEWIDKRLRGIAIRQELTDEWKTRNVKERKEFAILTNEISKATFGKTIGEYKQFKGLSKPCSTNSSNFLAPTSRNQNLRDHMNDWELILTMVGEKATTDITISKNAKGFPDCKESAKEGGTIAQHTRKELEQKTGKSLLSKDNYLYLNNKNKEKLK